MRSEDSAISSVVALMLILAILVTCFSIYATTYVPGVKQQAEIVHSAGVEDAFGRISADIDNLYAFERPVQFTEAVVLGGGDFLLSPGRSSGTLTIGDRTIGNLTVNGNTTYLNTTVISYVPSFSAWELQGYRYENGTLWITKGELETPLSYSFYSRDEGHAEANKSVVNRLKTMNASLSFSDPGNATLNVVTMKTVPGSSSVTGSGTAAVRLNATMQSKTTYNLSAGGGYSFSPSVPGETPFGYIASKSLNLTVRTFVIEVSVT